MKSILALFFGMSLVSLAFGAAGGKLLQNLAYAQKMETEVFFVTHATLREGLAKGDKQQWRSSTFQELSAGLETQPNYLVIRVRQPEHASAHGELLIKITSGGQELGSREFKFPISIFTSNRWLEYYVPVDSQFWTSRTSLSGTSSSGASGSPQIEAKFTTLSVK